MSARTLYLILTIALFLAELVFGIAAAILVLSPFIDIPLTVSWPVGATHGPVLVLDSPKHLAQATITLNQGEFAAVIDGWVPLLIQFVNLLVIAGIVVGVLVLLRRFAKDVAAAMPFTIGSAVRLRWIGLLLIAFPLWQFLVDMAWQFMLRDIPLVEGGRLLPAFSPETVQANDIRLLASFDFEFVFTGLLMLAVTEAFRIGIRLRQDNEAIV